MIELSDVSFSYEHSDQGVLDHVSLSIKPGECVLFCGDVRMWENHHHQAVKWINPTFL